MGYLVQTRQMVTEPSSYLVELSTSGHPVQARYLFKLSIQAIYSSYLRRGIYLSYLFELSRSLRILRFKNISIGSTTEVCIAGPRSAPSRESGPPRVNLTQPIPYITRSSHCTQCQICTGTAFQTADSMDSHLAVNKRLAGPNSRHTIRRLSLAAQ